MSILKEIASKLEADKSYTLVKMGEWGFPYKLHFKVHSLQYGPYAQYPESLVIYFIEKGKRKVKGIRFYGSASYAIWEGYQEVNTEMYVSSDKHESTGMIVSKSLRSFSPEYLKRALNSVNVKPMIVVEKN